MKPEVEATAGDPRGLPDEVVGRTELTNRRTIDRATLDMGDGTYALVQDAKPMHYHDSEGNWGPTYPAFEAVEERLANTTNAVKIGCRHAAASDGRRRRGAGRYSGDGGAGVQDRVRRAQRRRAQHAVHRRLERHRAGGPLGQRAWERRMHDVALSAAPLAGALNPPAPGLARLAVKAKPEGLELRVKLHLAPGTTLHTGGEPVGTADPPLETGEPLWFVGPAGDVLELQPPQAREEGCASTGYVAGTD